MDQQPNPYRNDVPSEFPEPLERLIRALSKLPTIGRKSARRLAFQLLKAGSDQPRELAHALMELHDQVHFCARCFYVTDADLCSFCSDPDRDASSICVVEEPQDVPAFEKAGIYKGTYHVLLGHLSPLQGIMPEDLKIEELLRRVRDLGGNGEVILATNPNVDGDATALYLERQLQNLSVRVTRLGLGLPIGGSLEYADELTLVKALETRKQL